MADLSAFAVFGANSPGSQVSVTRWNAFLAALETAFDDIDISGLVIADIAGLQGVLDAKLEGAALAPYITAAAVAAGYVPNASFTWANLGGKPAVFPPQGHTHPISEIIGLGEDLLDIDTALATKYSPSNPPPGSGGTGDWGDIGGVLADQLDLAAALAAKYSAANPPPASPPIVPEDITADHVVADDEPHILFIDSTANDVQITLPPALDNTSELEIRRVDQSVFDVTIIPDGTDSVDGDTDAILFPGESMTFRSNQTDTWWLL